MSRVFVYMLRCRDGSLYAGWTTDLTRRVNAHNRGTGARYTRSRLPVSVAAWWTASGKSEALKLEARLRRLSRKQKLIVIAGKDPQWPLKRRPKTTN